MRANIQLAIPPPYGQAMLNFECRTPNANVQFNKPLSFETSESSYE